MSLEIDVITLFPEMFDAVTKYGVTGRAEKNKIYQLNTWNPRDYTENNRRSIDDSPYGGGQGMVLLAEPLEKAIINVKDRLKSIGVDDTHVIYLSPQGRLLDHERVLALSDYGSLTLVCGRYEGVDERFIARYVDEEISIGNYVISGGELAAMVLIDSVVRHLPGSLGDNNSAKEDTFSNLLLEFPQYTRPEIFNGESVPSVLLSGNHAKIKRWRLQQSLGKTWLNRPDLLAQKRKKGLSEEEVLLLEEFKQQQDYKISE
ncbi:MAG: tRNA (guanosine(37)-N1)-methyltransferase TrmD [Nitrosomonas sp.]|nr:tRNA (guanosine(37)-N1)-methyltransferase TrmD [Nitrosomonas sp.]MBK7363753.1 tRNA (guanosine(37)-N1)-methyltransferase TrmD [Nitrosomonas sp.]